MKPFVMVNGLPGKMASEAALAISNSEDFRLLPFSFTGENMPAGYNIQGKRISLILPQERLEYLKTIQKIPFLSVDYTHPSVANSNCDFYCEHNLPFVIGTTGGDRTALEARVKGSSISAVIAPNMAKPIVAFQEMMQTMAEENPESLLGYNLQIVESHQQGKADTSGTAKAMVKYFNQLGIPFTNEQIKMIRDPEEQRKMHIPEEFLSGHGWHTYKITTNLERDYFDKSLKVDSLINPFRNFLEDNPSFRGYNVTFPHPEGLARISPDRNAVFMVRAILSASSEIGFEFTHNVNGRAIYANGTLDALRFLNEKVQAQEKGKAYSMIDVLNR